MSDLSIPSPRRRLDAPQDTVGPHHPGAPPMLEETAELVRLLSDPEASLEIIARHIESAPGLARAIRKAANSIELGLLYPVEQIPHAVTLLGRRRLSAVAFALHSRAAEAQALREAAAARYAQSLRAG